MKWGKAFKLDVIAWGRSLNPEAADAQRIGYRERPVAVAADADIVTLYVASTRDTRHLADRTFLEVLSEGAFFINNTRVAVVDVEALAWALDVIDMRTALDVMEGEPLANQTTFEHPHTSPPTTT